MSDPTERDWQREAQQWAWRANNLGSLPSLSKDIREDVAKACRMTAAVFARRAQFDPMAEVWPTDESRVLDRIIAAGDEDQAAGVKSDGCSERMCYDGASGAPETKVPSRQQPAPAVSPAAGPEEPPMELEREVRAVLNRYSAENASNTPDFILAQYLMGSLMAFNVAVQQRETWYGRDARPSMALRADARGEGTRDD